MIDVYYWPTPNGHKVTIFLEEASLDYKVIPINIGKGDQFSPEFLKISPNNRMPAPPLRSHRQTPRRGSLSGGWLLSR
jgi:GST-like protein